MKYKLNSKINPQNENYLQEILTARGLLTSIIDDFINPSKEMEYDYNLLDNIKRGAEMLSKYIYNNDPIFLIVDCDDDGVTSAAMIYNYIKRLNPNREIEWMVHSGKQHGIEIDKVPEYTKLLIVPDAGTNQTEEHKLLANRGVDILILDHHDADIFTEQSPACIINNQFGYPNKMLSGAGVVYKFLECCDDLLNVNYAQDYLDLAAQGIIGDLMDINDLETRYIVNYGLRHIKNPGLRYFLEKQSYSIRDIENPSPTDISFYIVPLVNAVIRVGSMDEKELLFRAFINGNGIESSTKRGAKVGDTEIVGQKAARVASNVKSRQQKIRDKSFDMVKMKIEKERLDENKVIVIALDELESEQVEQNLTGLIAMQVVAAYGKPTLLMRITTEGDYKGSARAPSNTDLTDFKQLVLDSNLFNYAQGHPQAYGLGIDGINIEKFINYSNEKLKDLSFDNVYEVDYQFNNDTLSRAVKLAEVIDNNRDIWAKTVEEPVIYMFNINFNKDDIRVMGQYRDTTKLEKNGISFMRFKDSEFAQKIENMGNVCINAIGTLQMNYFMGNATPQFIIRDYELFDPRF